MSNPRDKRARIRYGKAEDKYFFETWNWNTCKWEIHGSTELVASAEDPNGEKEYVHYLFLDLIARYATLGYSIDM